MDKSFDLQYFLKKHEKHKNKPVQFKSVAGGVKKRLEKSIQYRKSSRLSHLDSIRNLPSFDVPKPKSEIDKKVEHRRMQMEKWKEEKERKKRDAAAIKKKPFLTGVVHPPLKYVPPPPLKTMPSTSGRVTRSQSSKASSTQEKKGKLSKTNKPLQSFAPSNASFKPPEFKNFAHLPKLEPLDKCKKEILHMVFDPVVYNVKNKTCSSNLEKKNVQTNMTTSKSNTRSKSKQTEKPIKVTRTSEPAQKMSLQSSRSNSDNESSMQKVVKKNKSTRRSKQNEKKPLKSKDTTPKSESSSEERLRSPKSSSFEECFVQHTSLSHTPKTPEQIIDPKNISPCVTLSRGKDNARKEMKKKMEEGLLDGDNSNMENVEYFRAQLDSEVKRITEMCDTWEKISQEVPLSEPAMEALLSAVGQGRLLVAQKLAQFGSLVAACERPEPGATLVTPADLHGFWDMVFMQVENVDMRFKKLADLRNRNWVEEEQVFPTRKVAKVVKNNTKPAATSRLRDLIAAARKAKKEQSSMQAELTQNTEAESKNFEAGFFSVRSPVKSPCVFSTPSKPSLLKDVLSNEAKKASASKNSAACLAMLRASHIGKNVESPDTTAIEITTPKATLNLTATPAKSILKSTKVASTKRKSSKKSIKVVLFNDSDFDSLETKEDSSTQIEGNGDSAEDYIDILKSSTSGLTDLREKEAEDKENKSKAVLKRQNALDGSPILTRSRRKSMNTPLLDVSENVEYKKKSRKIKETTEDRTEKTPKRSTRKTKITIEVS